MGARPPKSARPTVPPTNEACLLRWLRSLVPTGVDIPDTKLLWWFGKKEHENINKLYGTPECAITALRDAMAEGVRLGGLRTEKGKAYMADITAARGDIYTFWQKAEESENRYASCFWCRHFRALSCIFRFTLDTKASLSRAHRDATQGTSLLARHLPAQLRYLGSVAVVSRPCRERFERLFFPRH